MKRIVLASCFAALATAVQAQGADHPSSRSGQGARQNPSPVSGVLNWLGDKIAPPAHALAVPGVPSREPRGSRGRISRCTEGERIITAYYAQGKRTASGQRFDPNGLTAAHRSLPFGTRLMVINPRNGKTVTVTVNDRGPYVRGVALDLSLGAAKAIGMRGTGAVCMAKLGRAS